MTHRLKAFRLQFLAQLTARGPAVLGECELMAADIDAALRKTAGLCPPVGAHACRLIAVDGSEVAYRILAEPDRRGALLLKFA